MSRFSSYIWKHSHKITNSLFHSDPGCETSSLVTFFPYSIKKKKEKERRRRRCSGGEVGAASFAIRNVVVEWPNNVIIKVNQQDVVSAFPNHDCPLDWHLNYSSLKLVGS
jgi:hypothetical protein